MKTFFEKFFQGSNIRYIVPYVFGDEHKCDNFISEVDCKYTGWSQKKGLGHEKFCNYENQKSCNVAVTM